jgi:hypothetical protein
MTEIWSTAELLLAGIRLAPFRLKLESMSEPYSFRFADITCKSFVKVLQSCHLTSGSSTMPWEAIKYVSSGFALCAFVVAALFTYLKNRSQEERKRIESAPPDDRADLVAKTLEIFNVDTTGLTRQQQFEIAMRQINGRIERFRLIAIVVVVLAITGAGLSAYALGVQKKSLDPVKAGDEGGPERTAAPEKIPPLVTGGAPVGTTFQNTFTKDGGSLECTNETVKVSPTEWEERPAPGVAAGCLVGAVIFKFTEREPGDPRYILLYDESRSVFGRLTVIEKGQLSPSEWRLVSHPVWNVTTSVTRIK